MEGQGLRDRFDDFEARNAVVFGASFDTPEENRAFAQDQEYPFPLLSADRTVGQQWDVARPADDRFADFPRRYSYLIDPAGIVRRAYDVTDVAGHADAVLADLDRLAS
ncbi:MAG: redoxin domain-containing protein [Acidimicrobiales bacterium]